MEQRILASILSSFVLVKSCYNIVMVILKYLFLVCITIFYFVFVFFFHAFYVSSLNNYQGIVYQSNNFFFFVFFPILKDLLFLLPVTLIWTFILPSKKDKNLLYILLLGMSVLFLLFFIKPHIEAIHQIMRSKYPKAMNEVFTYEDSGLSLAVAGCGIITYKYEFTINEKEDTLINYYLANNIALEEKAISPCFSDIEIKKLKNDILKVSTVTNKGI